MDCRIKARVAEITSRIRKKWFEGSLGHSLKEDQSFLSEYDKSIEREIRDLIAEIEPDALVVGEEFGFSAEDLKRCWQKHPIYTVDPIDGTHSFVSEGFAFCVAIARLSPGGTLEAVIGFPALDRVLEADWDGVRYIGGENFKDLSPVEMIGSNTQILVDSKIHRVVDINFPGKIRSFGSLIFHAVQVARGFYAASLVMGKIVGPWDLMPMLAVIEALGGEISFLGDINKPALTPKDILLGKYRQDRWPVLVVGHFSMCGFLNNCFKYRE